MMTKILVLHGPNLNLLGLREPSLYGSTTLDALNDSLYQKAHAHQCELFFLQANSESVLINTIHQALHDKITHIIINPAAFTHTSIALRDALLAVSIPFIEVHLSNIHSRESFRQQSFFSDKALGVISGLGVKGYHLALDAILNPL